MKDTKEFYNKIEETIRIREDMTEKIKDMDDCDKLSVDDMVKKQDFKH